MNRRHFSATLGGLTLAAVARVSRVAAREGPVVSARAEGLYRRALVLDCNSAPPEGDLPLSQADLDLVRGSGINVIKWSIGGINSNFRDTVAEIAQVQKLIEVHPRYFTQIRVVGDLERAKREGKLGIILSFESAEMHNGQLDSLTLFRNLGVLVM